MGVDIEYQVPFWVRTKLIFNKTIVFIYSEKLPLKFLT